MKKIFFLTIFTVLMFVFGGISMMMMDVQSFNRAKSDVKEWFPHHSFSKAEDYFTDETIFSEEVDGLKKIEFDATNATVTIFGENREDIVVQFSSSYDIGDLFVIRREGNTLKIEENDHHFLVGFLDVTIRVPQTFYGEVDIENTNGDISGFDLRYPISVESTNGSIDLSFSINSNVKAETTNGMIDIHMIGVPDADVKASTTNGKITIDGEDLGSDGKEIARKLGKGKEIIKTKTVNGDIWLNWGY